jgi:hypothetical protein
MKQTATPRKINKQIEIGAALLVLLTTLLVTAFARLVALGTASSGNVQGLSFLSSSRLACSRRLIVLVRVLLELVRHRVDLCWFVRLLTSAGGKKKCGFRFQRARLFFLKIKNQLNYF